jgi:DNA-binding XRE family transcriptional regulator
MNYVILITTSQQESWKACETEPKQKETHMAVEVKTKLRQYREELITPKVSQEAMARKIGISLQWYRQLESCEQNTSYSTANAILRALNTERQHRGQEALTLDQLELNIV